MPLPHASTTTTPADHGCSRRPSLYFITLAPSTRAMPTDCNDTISSRYPFFKHTRAHPAVSFFKFFCFVFYSSNSRFSMYYLCYLPWDGTKTPHSHPCHCYDQNGGARWITSAIGRPPPLTTTQQPSWDNKNTTTAGTGGEGRLFGWNKSPYDGNPITGLNGVLFRFFCTFCQLTNLDFSF